MANSQLDQEMEILQSFEYIEDGSPSGRSSSGDQTSDIKIKLLHHLVDFSRIFKQKPDEREVEELIKKNTVLVNELLDLPATVGESTKVIKSVPVDWKEILQQKLIDAKVNLDDAKVKELANKQLEATSKKMDDLADTFVRGATSLSRFEDKVTFDLQLTPIPSSTAQPVNHKTISLRSLIFDISLYNHPIDLAVNCSGVPANKSCRATIEATIKNQAGKRIWIRTFSKVYYKNSQELTIMDLIQKAEYENEALGLLKDNKIQVEMTIRADELVGL